MLQADPLLTALARRPDARSAGLASAQSAWTGGDDLPTNPLACDGTAGTVGGRRTMTAASADQRRPTATASRSPSSTCRS